MTDSPASLLPYLHLVLGDPTDPAAGSAAGSRSTQVASEWRTLRRVAELGRLAGLPALAIELGALHLDDVDVDEFIEWYRTVLERAVVVERSLVRAHDTLMSVGVRPSVLKGVATAHLDYPTPAVRSFGDVDILIHPDEIDRAIAALVRAGGRRDLPPRTRSWDRRFAKDIPITDRFGVEIDVHRTLDRGPFGSWIDLDELHRNTVTFALAGRTMRALDPPGRLMHAAYGLATAETDARLAHAVDLLLIARRIDDADGVVALARRWRAELVLAEAIETTTRLTGRAPQTRDGQALAADRRGDRAEVAPLAAYRSHGGTNASELVALGRALPNWRARCSYARALAIPDVRYVRARRSAGRPGELRTAARDVLRRIARRRRRQTRG